MNASHPIPTPQPERATALALVQASVAPELALLSRAVGRGRCLPLAGLGELRITPMEQGGAASSPDGVLLEAGWGALWLEHGTRLVRALSGFDLDAVAAAPDVQRAWFDAAVLGRLSGAGLGPLQRLARQALPPPGSTALYLHLCDGEHAVATAAWATPGDWQALFGAAAWQRVLAPLADYLALPVVAGVRLARHRLAPAIAATLAVGDVLLPERPDFDVDGLGWIRCAGRRARVRCDVGGTIELIELIEPTLEPAMEHETELDAEMWTLGEGGQAGALDSARVVLDFQLGTLSLTLGQLRALAPGAVLELAGGGPGALSIVCGGREVGQGEAVDVGGRLGVRVTRWGAPC